MNFTEYLKSIGYVQYGMKIHHGIKIGDLKLTRQIKENYSRAGGEYSRYEFYKDKEIISKLDNGDLPENRINYCFIYGITDITCPPCLIYPRPIYNGKIIIDTKEMINIESKFTPKEIYDAIINKKSLQ